MYSLWDILGSSTSPPPGFQGPLISPYSHSSVPGPDGSVTSLDAPLVVALYPSKAIAVSSPLGRRGRKSWTPEEPP